MSDLCVFLTNLELGNARRMFLDCRGLRGGGFVRTVIQHVLGVVEGISRVDKAFTSTSSVLRVLK